MLERFLSKDQQRRRGLRQAVPGVLQDFLATPLPARDTPCEKMELVSLDLETTGLDPARDSILSFGLVYMRGMSVQLETARHGLIQVDEQIPEEVAVIHQITDDLAATGRPLEAVLPEILGHLAGRVMLVH